MKASATILHSALQGTCLFVAFETELVLNRFGLMAAFPRNQLSERNHQWGAQNPLMKSSQARFVARIF